MCPFLTAPVGSATQIVSRGRAPGFSRRSRMTTTLPTNPVPILLLRSRVDPTLSGPGPTPDSGNFDAKDG